MVHFHSDWFDFLGAATLKAGKLNKHNLIIKLILTYVSLYGKLALSRVKKNYIQWSSYFSKVSCTTTLH